MTGGGAGMTGGGAGMTGGGAGMTGNAVASKAADHRVDCADNGVRVCTDVVHPLF